MYYKMIVFQKFQLTHEFWFQENKIVSLCQHLISTVSAMIEPAPCPQVFEATAWLCISITACHALLPIDYDVIKNAAKKNTR